MPQAIGDVLPAAAAVALSPIPIVAIVLGGEHARSAGAAFALGWVTGLSVVSVAVTLLAGGTEPGGATDTGIKWGMAAIGVLFLVMAARQWRKRPKLGERPEMPHWMATVGSAPWPRALLLGVAIGSITVVGAAVFALVAPRAAAGPLESILRFMADNNATIMMVLLLVLGLKILGDALGGV